MLICFLIEYDSNYDSDSNQIFINIDLNVNIDYRLTDILQPWKRTPFFFYRKSLHEITERRDLNSYLHWIPSARFGPGTGEEGGANVLAGTLNLGLPIRLSHK